ncbi:ribonuclease 3-like protein 1 isoform X2 [Populus nigra]|uniref:ribonuclease 3-like protein 1 isoform X2 n=1 Tax=Populus nigra TaxID=3691 RepID=UPI002B2656F2|nr:ribonuclease 3-like protein 1 isoform X2 [Populus nigra]
MEMKRNKCTQPKQLHINLKHLPPVDPATTNPFPEGARAGEGLEPAKQFDEEANTTADNNPSQIIKAGDDSSTIKNTTKVGEISKDDKNSHNDSGGPKISAKSQLLETLAANKWKPPLFECFKEEGPCHKKLFTYKVAIRIEGEASTVLECFGYPKPTKKTAAEHAAEGALWYLKHLGYFPIKKVKRKK